MNYIDERDNNGGFDVDSPYDADYSQITFQLKTDKIDKDVYVFGRLSDWSLG